MFSLEKKDYSKLEKTHLSIKQKKLLACPQQIKKKTYLQVTVPSAFIRKHGVDVERALVQVIGIRMILPDSVPLLSAFH